jgi:thioredoxin 1
MPPNDDGDDILDISFDDEDPDDQPDSMPPPEDDDNLQVTFDEPQEHDLQTQPDHQQPPDVCPKCGYDLMPLEAVCPRCGHDTTAAETPSEPHEQDEAPDESDQPDDSSTDESDYTPPPASQSRSGCSPSPCVIVAGCMLVLILVVSAVIFFAARHLGPRYQAVLGSGETSSGESLRHGPVTELDETDFDATVLQSDGWALVDFGAQWCGPCRQLEPIYHDLAAEYEGKIRFYSVDTDVSPRLGNRYVDRGIPTIVLFRDGRQVAKIVGFRDRQALQGWIEQNTR